MKLSILLFSIFTLALSDNGPFSMPLQEAAARLERMYAQVAHTVLANLDAEEESAKRRGEKANCTRSNILIRQEFGSMKKDDRKAYANAVLCLQGKKALTPNTNATGTKSRWNFPGLASIFPLGVDQALRTDCGYEGPIPYWNWPKWASAPQDSPIFNGDEYSVGGKGEWIPGRPAVISLPLPIPGTGTNITVQVETGLGGGCVTSGPFGNMTVNLGPIALGNEPSGPDGGLGYNPRCLKRDVGPAVAMKYTNYTVIFDSMNSSTIFEFQDGINSRPGIGPHGGGHYTISGDPGLDFWVAPGDPAFYLHHGQIDRLWSIWQALDPQSRQYALSGTNTMMNIPPSANTTLDRKIDVGYAGGTEVTMMDMMDTTKGPFCYMYI